MNGECWFTSGKSEKERRRKRRDELYLMAIITLSFQQALALCRYSEKPLKRFPKNNKVLVEYYNAVQITKT